ncbi:MAG: HAMP domain-containing histidine kinase [Deltaproteobacteria bacterium]|nr:HAMP domain-containing histidine kinase [Deltaproteobacteria bacterium]
MNSRRLVLRVYGFAAALSIIITVALLVLPRYMRGASYLEPHAALLQHMVDRWSLKDPAKFAEGMKRIEPRLRGKLSLYGASGDVEWTNTEPPLAAPGEAEIASLLDVKWVLATGRIIVRSDDSTLLAVYHPNRPGFPWGYVVPMALAILLVVGAASIWFSRRLARPLSELAGAARKFGEGDTTARAKLDREDELGQVGRAFDDMADRTAGVLLAQRQLMGDVSHELRTPLSRIRVAIELAAEDPSAAKDVLVDVGADLDEIDQLISDILTTARLDGEPNLTRRPTPLAELTERAVQRFTARFPRRELVQSLSQNVADLDIECDPVLLRRALDNLLDNAAKYSDPSSPVKLTVRAAPKPNITHVVFEVVDQGIGMSPEELGRAFTPFWRADGSRTRRTGGVGLGLALARRIARTHGGEVTLQSAVATGTTARLEVPVGG